MRIALVELSRTNRMIVSRLLQEGGHEVRSFEDGPEALAALASDATLNAVITGSELKSLSGLELVWDTFIESGILFGKDTKIIFTMGCSRKWVP